MNTFKIQEEIEIKEKKMILQEIKNLYELMSNLI